MKKVSSVVWKFFDRIQEGNRCVAVLCKLCESQYKYFGNTTNLRVHLINKHPIQWELSESGTLDETNFNNAVDTSSATKSTKRRKYRASSGHEMKIIEAVQTDSEQEDESATINLVRQMHGEKASDEEWLDEDPFQVTHIDYEAKPTRKKKMRKIKREIPSPTGLTSYYTVAAPTPEKIVYEDTRKDECSVFGEYIANKLRKIQSQRTRGNLQQLITTVLWQADYGMYENADTVKRVIMMSSDNDVSHVNNSHIIYENVHQGDQDQVEEIALEINQERCTSEANNKVE